MGECMGLWHIAALASVLGRPLASVYPEYGGHNVKRDVQRVLVPRHALSDNAAHSPDAWGRKSSPVGMK